MNLPVLWEVGVIFVLIELRIWVFYGNNLWAWLATALPLILVFWSWRKRKDNLKILGIQPEDFWKNSLFQAVTFFIFWRAIILVAEIWNPSAFSQPNLVYNFCKLVLLYYPWAWLQQLWLNGYFVNRLNTRLAGFLFAVVHLPNPVLFIVTWVGGTLSGYFFLKNRNLYFLALFHTILAVTIKYLFPYEWHHNLTIGPGYWHWTP